MQERQGFDNFLANTCWRVGRGPSASVSKISCIWFYHRTFVYWSCKKNLKNQHLDFPCKFHYADNVGVDICKTRSHSVFCPATCFRISSFNLAPLWRMMMYAAAGAAHNFSAWPEKGSSITHPPLFSLKKTFSMYVSVCEKLTIDMSFYLAHSEAVLLFKRPYLPVSYPYLPFIKVHSE